MAEIFLEGGTGALRADGTWRRRMGQCPFPGCAGRAPRCLSRLQGTLYAGSK